MPNTFTPEQIAQILEEFFKTVGTRQYIGARYVPIFGRKGEDSIEWDNTGTYEPLSIVLYQGNSYTSRQFVPVGVEITNQEFWALTGNYNAQVEQYRRETAAAKAAADAAQEAADDAQDAADTAQESADAANKTLAEYVGNIENVKSHGATGDGTTDDTQAFIDAFNAANANGRNIYIPAGRYIVRQDLPALSTRVRIFGESTATAEQNASTILDRRSGDGFLISYVNETDGIGCGIIGVSFDGGKTTKNCLDTDYGWDGIYQRIAIKDYTGCAIRTNHDDSNFENVRITGCGNSETDGVANYAVVLAGSSNRKVFQNCHIEHCRYMVNVEGGTLNGFSNCKFEMSTYYLPATTDAPIKVSSGYVYFDSCDFINIDVRNYADAANVASYDNVPFFVDAANSDCIVNGCTFYHGVGSGGSTTSYNAQAKYISLGTGSLTSCTFNKCSYVTPAIELSKECAVSDIRVTTTNTNIYDESKFSEKRCVIDVANERAIVSDVSMNGSMIAGFYPANRHLHSLKWYSNRRVYNVWQNFPNDTYVTIRIHRFTSDNLNGHFKVKLSPSLNARYSGSVDLFVKQTSASNANLYLMDTDLVPFSNGTVYASFSDGDVFLQIPTPNGIANYEIESDAKQPVFCCIEQDMTTVIASYANQVSMLYLSSQLTYDEKIKNTVKTYFNRTGSAQKVRVKIANTQGIYSAPYGVIVSTYEGAATAHLTNSNAGTVVVPTANLHGSIIDSDTQSFSVGSNRMLSVIGMPYDVQVEFEVVS